MGWDITFIRTRKLGEILQDEEFKIDFYDDRDESYLYVLGEDGDKCGVFLPHITKDNYKETCPVYGCCTYGFGTLYLMWRLYEKCGIRFVDDNEQIYCELFEYCKDEKEEDGLIEYCCAEEFTSRLKDALSEDDELCKTVKRYKPLFDRLLDESKKDLKTEEPIKYKPLTSHVSNGDIDDLPF